jgi:trehalose 6-phosphate phosphatase
MGRSPELSQTNPWAGDPSPPLLDLKGAALFLDLDGTLAPLAARPSEVGPDRRRSALLRALVARMNGRVAILSGRPLAEVDRILEGSVHTVAAVHGLDRRGQGADHSPPSAHPALSQVTAAFRALAATTPGLLVEDKGVSAALHYRLAPEAAGAALALAERLAAQTGLGLQPGHMVIELRGPGPDKGDSLRHFMQTPPFLGAIPIVVGDDLTDEPAFVAARSLGGLGVLVGPPRQSAATRRLADVDAVLAWLEAAL